MNSQHPRFNTKRFGSLELGRGCAALLVILYHNGGICEKYFGSFPSLHTPFRGGHAGVEYFFVLSGFIIYFAHAGDRGRSDRILDFVKKRAIRIVPMYWIVISLMTMMFILHPVWGTEKALDAWKIFRDYC